MKGKVYSACVQCVMTYGSETWPMRVEDMRRLESREDGDQMDVWNDFEEWKNK